jgi:hypothetical protein
MLSLDHKYCKYDPTTKTLLSTGTPDRGHILVPTVTGATPHPALILIDAVSNAGEPRIQYRIESQVYPGQENGAWYATALLVSGGEAPNPEDPTEPIVPGDVFIVYDPHNLYPNPTLHQAIPQSAKDQGATGSIGYAVLRTKVNTANTLSPERWEVEEQSRPVTKMKVRIESCLLHSMNQTIGYFDFNDVSKLSGSIGTDFPLTAIAAPGGKPGAYSLAIYNPLKLQAIYNSDVWIELDDSSRYSTSSLTIPHALGGNLPEYHIVAVEQPIARWAKLSKNGAIWEFTGQFREGYDPTVESACRPTTNGADTCAEDGTEAWAFYKPEDHQYEAISTESALLGPPVKMSMVHSMEFDGCDLTYTKSLVAVFCAESPQLLTTKPTFQTISVVTGAYATGSQICMVTARIPVCDVQLGEVFCIDICPMLCECPEFYALPDTCDPPPCYTYPCSYRWSATLSEWVQYEDCPLNCYCADPPLTPGEFDGQIITTQCSGSPPPVCDGNCTDCSEGNAKVKIASVLHDDNVNGVSFSLGALISSGPCSWTHNGIWSLRTGGTQAGTVTITKSGSTWAVSFTNSPARTPAYSYTNGTASCNFESTKQIQNGENAFLKSLVECVEPAPLATRAVELQTLGDQFVKEHPSLFSGCSSCRTGVIAVLNRWSSYPTDEQISRVSETIHSKNRTTPIQSIIDVVTAACRRWFNGQN